MPTYAITGSAGYVGTRMTRWLLEASPDNRVLGFDVRPSRLQVRDYGGRLEHHLLDVRDPQLGARLVGKGVRSLLHFAFVLDPLYDEREMADIDLGGTRNVFRAVREAGIGHLVATSSTTAYGALADNPVPLREDDPTRATSDFCYAHDKALMDQMLRDFAAQHPEVKVCVVRPCIVLGPNVSNYIASTLLTLPVTTLLDGNDPQLQFIHEDDLVRFLASCVEHRAAGEYNAVGTGALSLRELARRSGKPVLPVPHRLAFGAVWGVRKLKLLGFNLPPGILEFFRHSWLAAGDKAARELGFRPEFSTEQCWDIVLERKREIVDAFREQLRARGKR